MKTKHTAGKWIAEKCVNDLPGGGKEEVWDVNAHTPDGMTSIADCGSTKYPECKANAYLIAAAKIGFEVADAILAQEADGISRKDFIVRKAFEFMKQADPETLEIYKELIGRRIGGDK